MKDKKLIDMGKKNSELETFFLFFSFSFCKMNYLDEYIMENIYQYHHSGNNQSRYICKFFVNHLISSQPKTYITSTQIVFPTFFLYWEKYYDKLNILSSLKQNKDKFREYIYIVCPKYLMLDWKLNFLLIKV